METLFDIILISSESDRADEVKIVSTLFGAGAQTFHLRKPKASKEDLIKFLKALPEKFHSKIILHSHFPLAERFRVAGIHLNETHKERIGAYSRFKIVSASFHLLEELKANTFPYEYVFLSPIFDSISKPGYGSGFDLKLLTEEMSDLKNRDQTFPKVIALGGVTENNLHLIKDIGFSGAAVLGAVWGSDDPVKAFLRINAIAGKL